MSYRLLVEPACLRAGPYVVTGADYHYLFRVRRARVGQSVTLFDGAGREALATVAEVVPDRGVLMVEPPVRTEPSACHIVVAQALIKGERMDWSIQKLVELGVSEIHPVRTERTVIQLTDDRARKRRRRFAEIATNAARQSRRARIPEIAEIRPLDQFWCEVSGCELKLILRAGAGVPNLRDALPDAAPAGVCVVIGPEGGFTDAEVAAAERAGFDPVGLGQYILRAETASLAAAVVLGVAFGDLAG